MSEEVNKILEAVLHKKCGGLVEKLTSGDGLRGSIWLATALCAARGGNSQAATVADNVTRQFGAQFLGKDPAPVVALFEAPPTDGPARFQWQGVDRRSGNVLTGKLSGESVKNASEQLVYAGITPQVVELAPPEGSEPARPPEEVPPTPGVEGSAPPAEAAE